MNWVKWLLWVLCWCVVACSESGSTSAGVGGASVGGSEALGGETSTGGAVEVLGGAAGASLGGETSTGGSSASGGSGEVVPPNTARKLTYVAGTSGAETKCWYATCYRYGSGEAEAVGFNSSWVGWLGWTNANNSCEAQEVLTGIARSEWACNDGYTACALEDDAGNPLWNVPSLVEPPIENCIAGIVNP